MTLGGGPGGIFLDVPGISIIHRRRVFFGRRMNKNMGKYLRNRILIQLGMEWVLGPLQTNKDDEMPNFFFSKAASSQGPKAIKLEVQVQG